MNPQGAQQAQAQISPVQVLASIEDEASTGWCIFTSMILMRVRLDREGATEEDRKALLDFWYDNYVEANVERWKQQLDNTQNRMAAMQQGGNLTQLLNRLEKMPQELRQKFGTFILNGVDQPVDSIREAVEQFETLQKAAKAQNQTQRGGDDQ